MATSISPSSYTQRGETLILYFLVTNTGNLDWKHAKIKIKNCLVGDLCFNSNVCCGETARFLANYTIKSCDLTNNFRQVYSKVVVEVKDYRFVTNTTLDNLTYGYSSISSSMSQNLIAADSAQLNISLAGSSSVTGLYLTIPVPPGVGNFRNANGLAVQGDWIYAYYPSFTGPVNLSIQYDLSSPGSYQFNGHLTAVSYITGNLNFNSNVLNI